MSAEDNRYQLKIKGEKEGRGNLLFYQTLARENLIQEQIGKPSKVTLGKLKTKYI